MKRVVLSIDRVVLHGIELDDRHAFVAGFECELGRILQGQGVRTSEQARVRTESVGIPRGANAGIIAHSLARAVAGALKP
jgi:hypothetical protein